MTSVITRVITRILHSITRIITRELHSITKIHRKPLEIILSESRLFPEAFRKYIKLDAREVESTQGMYMAHTICQ
jgi:hypothetical protein